MTSSERKPQYLMALVLFGGILVMAAKFVAWYLTGSNAILSDALESIINVVAGAFAWYSVWLSARPRDAEHPYGHGKIEFFAAGFEGALILIAGLFLAGKALYGFWHPQPIESLPEGIGITAVAGVLNGLMGWLLVRTGKKYHSLALVADGRHLLADTLTSLGLLAGLLILMYRDIWWLDNALALLFGLLIIRTGYLLIRKSIAGLMDETDFKLAGEVIEVLQKNRKEIWIDVHNMRIQKFGSGLHVDCHTTLPWYLSLEESHNEVEEMELLLNREFGNRIEIFIHSDPCRASACPICPVKNCKVRKVAFEKRLDWDLENVLTNERHSIETKG